NEFWEHHTFFYSHGKFLRFCSLVVGFLYRGLKQSLLTIDNKCFLALLTLHTTCERDIDHSLGQLENRKSTRLNSSHVSISYAVFCLKKKSITSYFSLHRGLIVS